MESALALFYLFEILRFIGVPALVSGLVTCIIKVYYSERVKAAFQKEIEGIKAELQKEIEIKKASLQGELEGLKAGYTKVLDENQIRFSQLYVDQANALKLQYSHIAETNRTLMALTAYFKPGRSGEDLDESEKKLRKEFADSLNASVFYFHANSVLLPKEVCVKISQLHKEMKDAYIVPVSDSHFWRMLRGSFHF